MTNMEENIQTPQPTTAPPPTSKAAVFPIFFIVLILVLLAATGVFVYQNKQLQKQIAILQSQPTPVPSVANPSPTETSTPTPDPTANWKTYTNNTPGFVFKYPETYVLTTPEENFINIRPTASIPEQYSDISIDARTSGNYSNFQTAILKVKEGLINLKVESLSNVEGELVSGSIDGGIGGGREIKNAVIKYKNGAISIQYLNSNIGFNVYKQILSTFKFIDVTGKLCQSDADCGSGYICMVVAGNVSVDENGKEITPPKTCYPKDAPLPQ